MNSKTYPDTKKISEDEVLLTLAKAGEAGLTVTEILKQVTKLKKQLDQEIIDLLYILNLLKDDGEIWCEEDGESADGNRYHFYWDGQRDC